MPSLGVSVAPTAEIIVHPRSFGIGRAVLKVEDRLGLTEAELLAVREAIVRLPLPWFDASEQAADTAYDLRRDYAYLNQIAGPFIANFKITRSVTAFIVCLDDGEHPTEEWNGFLTIADAVALIGYYVEWILIGWGLQVA